MSHPTPEATVSAAPEAPEAVRAETSSTPQAVFDLPPRRRTGTVVALVVAIVVLAVAVLAVLGYLLLALGGRLTFFGAVLALVPLAIVLLGVRWIDRWEPEPRILQILAFTWGAAMAVLVALVVDAGVSTLLAAGEADLNYTVFLQTVVQAPLVEESAKALGVLIVYLAARRYFDGPVDGIVYAALVAGGFAFTENIQYFAVQIAESGRFDVAVGEIFFIRGLLSPFAHVLFTACAGFLIGVAARRGSAIGGILAFLAGLVPAILMHAFWNGALFFAYDFYVYYLVVQVPIFAVAVLIVAWLRRREAAMTQRHLRDYAAAGWFHPDEVAVLGTWAGRRQATAWARSRGVSRLMRDYVRDATQLAFTRNRIVSGRDRLRSGRTEAELLARVTESRRRLAAV